MIRPHQVRRRPDAFSSQLGVRRDGGSRHQQSGGAAHPGGRRRQQRLPERRAVVSDHRIPGQRGGHTADGPSRRRAPPPGGDPGRPRDSYRRRCAGGPSAGFRLPPDGTRPSGGRPRAHPAEHGRGPRRAPVERARPAVATLSITTAAGIGLGYPITGLIAQYGGLHVAFWFGSTVSALAFVVATLVIPSSAHHPPRRLDASGAVLLGVALAGLLLAISEGGAGGGPLPAWSSSAPCPSPGSPAGSCWSCAARIRSSRCGCCACGRCSPRT